MSDIHKNDDGKAILTLVPRQIIWKIARVREYGLKKYPKTGEYGWKNLSIDRLQNATYRHFMMYLDDPFGLDEESGLPHLWHLACNVAFLCERENIGEYYASGASVFNKSETDTERAEDDAT